jgi:hypothetical protein
LKLLVEFVPRTSCTPVASWFWQTEGRSAERVILAVRPSEFILSEFQSPREEFLSAPIQSPLSGRLIGPSTHTSPWRTTRTIKRRSWLVVPLGPKTAIVPPILALLGTNLGSGTPREGKYLSLLAISLANLSSRFILKQNSSRCLCLPQYTQWKGFCFGFGFGLYLGSGFFSLGFCPLFPKNSFAK